MSPPDDLILKNLGQAIQVTLKNLCDDQQRGLVANLADHWVQHLARATNFGVERPPAVEREQMILPFESPHRFMTELYSVTGGGISGGPTVDVLLQVWFNTESMKTSFGIPLVFQVVPSFGPVPNDTWNDLRETAVGLNNFTAAGRIIVVGNPNPFETQGWFGRSESPLYGVSTTLLAGMTTPPRGMSGRILEHFAYDLISGWLGDCMLGGNMPSAKLTDFLSFFDIRHLLRLRVTQQDI